MAFMNVTADAKEKVLAHTITLNAFTFLGPQLGLKQEILEASWWIVKSKEVSEEEWVSVCGWSLHMQSFHNMPRAVG